MKKKLITETESHCDAELSGELSEIIEWLQEKKVQGWETMDIDPEIGELIFSMSRLETDKEFEKRKKKVLKQKEKLAITKAEIEKKQFELYQKLKKKYENNINNEKTGEDYDEEFDPRNGNWWFESTRSKTS